MRVLVFGSTGMVGHGVLAACVKDPAVREIVAVVRAASGRTDAKLHEVVVPNLINLSSVSERLSGFDACFFCIGVSAFGMSEAAYTAATYDLTISVAQVLAVRNPGMTFVYVTGAGTDSSERGRAMWARVKGRTENALLALPFRAAFMLRPGFILPLRGARSKTAIYRVIYTATTPLFPLIRRLFPRHVVTTEEVGRAMIHVVRHGYSRPILEASDIAAISRESQMHGMARF